MVGDFNMLRGAADKNQGHLDNHLCSLFNSTIDCLGVAELQLHDCLFTWSNMRSIPTLARLDRAFVNNSTPLPSPPPLSPLYPGKHPTINHCWFPCLPPSPNPKFAGLKTPGYITPSSSLRSSLHGTRSFPVPTRLLDSQVSSSAYALLLNSGLNGIGHPPPLYLTAGF